MSELLAAAAAAMDAPETLVERSAAARAAAAGVSVEEILTAWAGGAPAPVGSAPAESAPAPSAPAAEETAPPPGLPPAPTAAPVPAAPAPAAVAVAAGPPIPERVGLAEAGDYEAVVTAPVAGILEKVASTVPRWLGLLFAIAPLVGLTYLISFAGGPTCGEGGQLAVDRLTGEVENCDGSEFAAAGGAGGVDVRAVIGQGQAVYAAASSCESCHGAGGGGGTGPALAGAVLSTFSMCSDHLEWVRLGTTGFEAANRPTYGDTGKPVGAGGQMPSFDNLTEEELTAVVFFERVVFGGQDPAEAVVDCGLADPEGDAAGEETPADPAAEA